jgi:putative membrane protein insertion efficiency factor
MKFANKFKPGPCSHRAKSTAWAGRPVLLATAVLSSIPVLLIRAYQLTRFLRQPSCRFYPSCSQYTVASIERFGFVRGLFLGSLRILRCHPFHPGGMDEVPVTFSVKLPGLDPGVAPSISQGIKKVTSAIPAIWGDQVRGKG